VARDERLAAVSERDIVEMLVGGFAAAGLPIALSGAARPKPRVASAAPLPRGATAEADLVELFLAERLPVDEVRRKVAVGLPEGMRLVMLEDEWIGAPSLASRVAAVVYRVDVWAGGPAPAPGSASPTVRVVEWDEETGRGTLAVRFERDASGRLGRPDEAVSSLTADLRIVSVARISVELAGE